MRPALLLRSLPLIALLSACSDPEPGANTADVPDASADSVAVDHPVVDSGASDVPSMDVPRDTPSTDVPSTDVPSTDVPATDVPATDVPSSDVPSTDVPSTDAPTAQDVPVEECIGRPAACASGTAGGSCSDALSPPECVDGSWRCPSGTIPITMCACIGRPPGACTCTAGGWVCSDAGR